MSLKELSVIRRKLKVLEYVKNRAIFPKGAVILKIPEKLIMYGKEPMRAKAKVL
jgi:hypothetical protein